MNAKAVIQSLRADNFNLDMAALDEIVKCGIAGAGQYKNPFGQNAPLAEAFYQMAGRDVRERMNPGYATSCLIFWKAHRPLFEAVFEEESKKRNAARASDESEERQRIRSRNRGREKRAAARAAAGKPKLPIGGLERDFAGLTAARIDRIASDFFSGVCIGILAPNARMGKERAVRVLHHMFGRPGRLTDGIENGNHRTSRSVIAAARAKYAAAWTPEKRAEILTLAGAAHAGAEEQNDNATIQ